MHKIKGPRDRARREPGRGRERQLSKLQRWGQEGTVLSAGSALGRMFRLKSHQGNGRRPKETLQLDQL
ncbi:tannase [Aspergillus luchuensis]|uniref:Tannase n=1 Tax=Aspergillus kawachii TaxID=1069201 RepID=A0A146FDH5_ASPKA|nr:tannase [Aspergillus luchuensis]